MFTANSIGALDQLRRIELHPHAAALFAGAASRLRGRQGAGQLRAPCPRRPDQGTDLVVGRGFRRLLVSGLPDRDP